MKGQIADMMEGQGSSKGPKAGAGSRFSVEELKELFKLQLDTKSDTYDLICKGSKAAGASAVCLFCMVRCHPVMPNGACLVAITCNTTCFGMLCILFLGRSLV